MFFQMDMDGVLPIAPRIDEHPVFGAVLRYSEAEFITVREPVIDDPLAIAAVEFEVPRDPRRDDRWQLVEHRVACWVNAAVGDRGPDPELYTILTIGVSASKNVALRPLSVILLQSVLEANRCVAAYQTLDLVEVNDDVVALRDPNAEAGDLQRRGQQVAVISDHPEWDHRARAQRIGEE